MSPFMKETVDRNIKLTELQQLSKAQITSGLGLEELFQNIVNNASSFFETKISALLLLENNYLVMKSGFGLAPKIIKETKIPLGESISGRVAKTGRPVLTADIKSYTSTIDSFQEEYYTHSFASAPLVLGDTVIGVLNISDRVDGSAFTLDQLDQLTLFADQSSISIEYTKLVDRERQKSEELKQAYKKLQETQAQLIQSEKMATIGILAGGVAHEINTPLGTILTNAEMLKSEMQTKYQKECLELIEKSLMRCKLIVEQLLKYSRVSPLEFEPVELNRVIDEVCILLEHQLSNDGITINKEYGRVPLVDGNANELGQVFTNIILNARDGIKKTYDETRSKGDIWIKTFREEASVVVEIKDDGIGIPSKDLGKIFDPFFTTKDVGKGTGLGLSVSHRIIEKHQGKIEVKSKPKQGTTLRIELPVKKGAIE